MVVLLHESKTQMQNANIVARLKLRSKYEGLGYDTR